jgi:hypothetical protein
MELNLQSWDHLFEDTRKHLLPVVQKQVTIPEDQQGKVASRLVARAVQDFCNAVNRLQAQLMVYNGEPRDASIKEELSERWSRLQPLVEEVDRLQNVPFANSHRDAAAPSSFISMVPASSSNDPSKPVYGYPSSKDNDKRQPRDVLNEQRLLMDEQDRQLGDLHRSIGHLRSMAVQIKGESDDSVPVLDTLTDGVQRTLCDTQRSTERAKKL